MATGTVTVTRIPNVENAADKNIVRRVIIDWISDDMGDVAYDLDLNGEIVRVVTVPGAGANQPDDNYDVTLVDAYGIDVLRSMGTNRDETNTEEFVPYTTDEVIAMVQEAIFHEYLSGRYTFTVAAAGDTLSGQAVLYLK